MRRRNKPIPTVSCKKPSQEMVWQELTFFQKEKKKIH